MGNNSTSIIMDAVRRIVQAAHVSSRQAQGSLGLSSAQLFVLKKLEDSQGKPLSLSDLAALTLTHISSVSVVVRRLVEHGLVLRDPAASDRRRMEVRLTEAGVRVLAHEYTTIQERLIAALERMEPSRHMALAALLGEWIEQAGLAEEEAGMFFEDSSGGGDAEQ